MKATQLIGMSVMALALSCCSAKAVEGSEKKVSKTIRVENFNAINCSAIADIVYSQDKEVKVSLSAPDNLTGKVEVYVKNNTLYIKTPQLKNTEKNSSIKVEINSPSLERIESSNVGDILLKGTINLGKLNITDTGVGDITVENLNCQNLYINTKGVGDIELKGTANTATYIAKGVGDIKAYDFEVGSLTVENKSVGDVECYASEISVENRGVGDVKYKGKPVVKKLVDKGVGDVESVK